MRIVLTIALLTSFAPLEAGAQRNAAESAIREAVQKIPAALNSRDWEAAAAPFLEEGDVILPGGARIQGREAIQALWEERWADVPERKITLTARSVRQLGTDFAIVDATAEFSAGEPARDRATFIMVRRDGVWKVAALRVMQAENP